MIEFILLAFLFATTGISIQFWNVNYQKPKYSLKPIFNNWTVYPAMACAVFYIYLEATVFMRNYWFLPYQQVYKTITLLSYFPLIMRYRLYESAFDRLRRNNDFINIVTSPMVIGTVCIALGTMLNLIVMHSNNNLMPVFPTLTMATGYLDTALFSDGIHILGHSNTQLIPLSDIFDIGYSVMSVGDILVRLNIFILLYCAIKKSNKLLK